MGFRRYRNDTKRRTDTTEDGTVLGVDLGVENIAAMNTARFFVE
jgi:putative transposase